MAITGGGLAVFKRPGPVLCFGRSYWVFATTAEAFVCSQIVFLHILHRGRLQRVRSFVLSWRPKWLRTKNFLQKILSTRSRVA